MLETCSAGIACAATLSAQEHCSTYLDLYHISADLLRERQSLCSLKAFTERMTVNDSATTADCHYCQHDSSMTVGRQVNDDSQLA